MKKPLWFISIILIISSVLAVSAWILLSRYLYQQEPIKIGILHSQTGSLALDEKTLINAELMAIEEINAAGGLLGRKLQAIVADGKSDEFAFEQEAIRLITKEKVDVLVGCWSSASRKRVKEVVEEHKKLLLYPVQYEGVEESQNIIYLGSTPNQSIIPAVTWCFNNLGKRFFLIGSDYVFPRIAHKIMKLHIESLGGQVVGESFIKLGNKVPPEQIQTIVNLKPDVICNTINGDTNTSFFKELLAAGITSDKIPTISFSVSEPAFKKLELASIIGTYAAFTYYQDSHSPINRLFVQNFKKRYGADASVSDNSQSAYSLIHMWAQAYVTAGSSELSKIVPELKKVTYNSPAGIIYLDPNQNCWQRSLIGKFIFNGEFFPVWESERNIQPEPYPPYLEKSEWNDYLKSLYEGWGKRWSAA